MKREVLRQEWRSKVADFEGSGLSAKQFCLERSLNYANLLRWRNKFREPETYPEATSIFEEIGEAPRLGLASGSLKIEVDNDITFDSLVRVIGALCHAAQGSR